MLPYQIEHSSPDDRSSTRRKSQQYDANALVASCEHKLPEVLVLSEENPTLAKRQCDYALVVSTGHCLCNGQNIEAFSTQRANSSEVATLVGEKLQHRNRVDALHVLFVSERYGGVGQRSANILTF